MKKQLDGTAQLGGVQLVVVRGQGAQPFDVARLARHVECALVAVAAVAAVLWVIAHLVHVAFEVALIAYVTKLAGRLVRL